MTAAIFLGVLLLVGLLYLRFAPKHARIPTTFEQGHASLDRIRDWASWMTGLQTAAIAAFGFWLEHNGRFSPESIEMRWSMWALISFGLSILVATWVLSCLPSIEQRLIKSAAPETKDAVNDVFEQPIYSHSWIRWFRLGTLTALFHGYFVSGALASGVLMFVLFDAPLPPPAKVTVSAITKP